jgi:hypothetical protein
MESTLLIQDGLGEKLALAVQFSCSFVFGLAVALYYCWQVGVGVVKLHKSPKFIFSS